MVRKLSESTSREFSGKIADICEDADIDKLAASLSRQIYLAGEAGA